jgi:hypothetical protein
LLFSLEEGVSRDLGMSRTKAESNCRSKLIQQFIDKDPQVFKINGSKRISLKVSLSSINYYYRNTSYQLPDSKTYQNEDGSYLSKSTCAVSLNDVKAEGNVVAIVSY